MDIERINSLAEAGPLFGFRVWYSPARNIMPVTEISYMGKRIVANQYNGLYDNIDTMGFKVPVAFVVLDELDEHALPTIQHWFWSPHDAAAAIRFVEWIGPRIDLKRWPTTVAYEYNMMVAYRRSFDHVYVALREIEDLCKDAIDFDDNPTTAILDRIKLLRQVVAEGR